MYIKYPHWSATRLGLSISAVVVLLVGRAAMVVLDGGHLLVLGVPEAEAARPAGVDGKDWGDPKVE